MATIIGNLKRLFIDGKNLQKAAFSGRAELNAVFRFKYTLFKELLAANTELLGILSDIEEKLKGEQIFGASYIRTQAGRAVLQAFKMVKSLNVLSGNRHPALYEVLGKINSDLTKLLEERNDNFFPFKVMPLSSIIKKDADWVGGKSANLGEIRNHLGLPVPEGFAITVKAFDSFMENNGLKTEILKRKNLIDINDLDMLSSLSSEIRELIKKSQVSDDLKKDIDSAYKAIWGENSEISLAVRSSAMGEDGELSYAGQYLTLLNVRKDQICEAYKSIIASLYSARAISYRISKGIYDDDMAMAVACIRMVDSVASGVMYTRHPYNVLDENIIINSVWGLGPYAVDGIVKPDTYVVSKDDEYSIKSKDITEKTVMLTCSKGGGIKEAPVSIYRQASPCLDEAQIRTLASYGQALESYYKCSQDVEWALDEDGRIIILQSRPLNIKKTGDSKDKKSAYLNGYKVIIDDCEVASQGAGSGRVHHVYSERDLVSFPPGSILFAKHSSPEFVLAMKSASAIVAESGSVSGHMAALAREFSVPTLVGAENAMEKISPGQIVTVDAYAGRIYDGFVPELVSVLKKESAHMKETAVYQHLKKVAELMTPLHLVNPRSTKFTASACRTLHDIARFAHENSYNEMFKVSDLASKVHGWSVKLQASLPIDLHLIDLGKGIKEDPESDPGKVGIHQITSGPFKALLNGMLNKDISALEPKPINFSGLMSVMREQVLSPGHVGERFGDRSYALIADKYLNFSSRVGYHYSVIDAYCGETINKNYITFSFKGGAADKIRRGRRVRAIAMILEKEGFTVDVKADKVDARLQKYPRPYIEGKLDILGRLLIFTRQMDMLMHTEQSVEWVAMNFVEGNYRLRTSGPN